jgi:hypothetical protein
VTFSRKRPDSDERAAAWASNRVRDVSRVAGVDVRHLGLAGAGVRAGKAHAARPSTAACAYERRRERGSVATVPEVLV